MARFFSSIAKPIEKASKSRGLIWSRRIASYEGEVRSVQANNQAVVSRPIWKILDNTNNPAARAINWENFQKYIASGSGINPIGTSHGIANGGAKKPTYLLISRI